MSVIFYKIVIQRPTCVCLCGVDWL